jgi:hypothetical protein
MIAGLPKSNTEDSVAMRWENAGLVEPSSPEPKSRPEVAMPPARAERRAESPVGLDPFDRMGSETGSGAIEFDEGALKAVRPSRDDLSPPGATRPHGVMAARTSVSMAASTTRSAQAVPAVRGTPTGNQQVTAKANVIATPVPEPEPRSPFFVWGVAGLVATLAVAGLAFGLRSMRENPPTHPPVVVTPPVVVDEVPDPGTGPTKVAPSFVNVIVNIQPPTALVRMRLDGVSGATSPLRVRSGRVYILEVSADGFEEQRVEVRAERDSRVHVQLQPIAH